MTKEQRLKKCEAVYDMWHIEDWKALETAKMMLDFAMRFRDCVLINPDTYDMFRDFINNQPYSMNAMRSIKSNMEEFKRYFQWEIDYTDKKRWPKKLNWEYEWKRLCVEKKSRSLYNPIMMIDRLLIPCTKCAIDPNTRETRYRWFHIESCKKNHPEELT